MKAIESLVPATILTGFLGAGKSTLLRRVLCGDHGRKVAVIENEFAAENIDSEIIAVTGDEQIIQLSNGCLCCSIRDDLRATLSSLAERRRSREIAFDHLIIETTGLADPGPIAQTFFLDPDVAAHYRPDAVLSLVDAKHAMAQLDARAEARRQVGFADRLFISKTDLVSEADAAALSLRLGHMNPRAPQRVVPFGEVPIDDVFDVGGFNLSGELELFDQAACAHQGHHGHHDHHGCAGHADDVKSFVFRSTRPFHDGRFGQFMNTLLKSYGAALLRYKGVLNMLGQEHKVIFQGVHQLMSHHVGQPWTPSAVRETRLVFIGLDLPKALMLSSLERCLV